MLSLVGNVYQKYRITGRGLIIDQLQHHCNYISNFLNHVAAQDVRYNGNLCEGLCQVQIYKEVLFLSLYEAVVNVAKVCSITLNGLFSLEWNIQ